MSITPDELIQRGEKAGHIINNDLWAEAYEEVKRAYIAEAQKCAATDDVARFRYIEAIRIVDTVRIHFEAVLAQGQLTAGQAAQFQSVKKGITRFF
jgi:hypothetical protein